MLSSDIVSRFISLKEVSSKNILSFLSLLEILSNFLMYMLSLSCTILGVENTIYLSPFSSTSISPFLYSTPAKVKAALSAFLVFLSFSIALFSELASFLLLKGFLFTILPLSSSTLKVLNLSPVSLSVYVCSTTLYSTLEGATFSLVSDLSSTSSKISDMLISTLLKMSNTL